jgi:hypothetical protein
MAGRHRSTAEYRTGLNFLMGTASRLPIERRIGRRRDDGVNAPTGWHLKCVASVSGY